MHLALETNTFIANDERVWYPKNFAPKISRFTVFPLITKYKLTEVQIPLFNNYKVQPQACEFRPSLQINSLCAGY